MALKVQSSFSAGELDPALWERTTFDKYQSGLARARNTVIGQSGRVISRPGRTFFAKTKLSNSRCLIYSPPNSGHLIELGVGYLRHYDFNGNLLHDIFTTFTLADLSIIHFEASKSWLYIFCAGKLASQYFLNLGVFANNMFVTPGGPITGTIGGTATGYMVDYVATFVQDGQESVKSNLVLSGPIPINVGETSTLTFTRTVASTGVPAPTEVRVYRRPQNGGAYGYIGNSTSLVTTTDYTFTFEDKGQASDYSHSPPDYILAPLNPIAFLPRTGIVYQQRLLLTLNTDEEAIVASRTGYQQNFLRDFPLAADSALNFKSGTSGYARVLRMLDNDGLSVFTTVGVFLSTGALTPDNLALAKKGSWLIDDIVPPLGVPGGVFFVDAATNSVRELRWSFQVSSYTANEVSVFSNHLFLGKRIVSWGFETGDLGCLWTVFDDGTFASFTYDSDQQMNAWTPHDSVVNVEAIADTKFANKVFFLTEKDGERYIEMSVPRYVSGSTLQADPEAYMGHSIAAMDSMLSFRTKLNDNFVGADNFVIVPVTPGDWSGQLGITTSLASPVFITPGYGDVGSVLRFFDDDGTAIDLTIITHNSTSDIVVQPSAEFPSDHATDARIFKTAATFTGLTHLEGESVSVVADGYVVASPNNDEENYPELIVSGGSITLPDNLRGAIVHIGRPITYDVQTLDIDTVEQRPVLIESKIVNKIYLKTLRSRGLFAGSKFPLNNKVKDLVNVEVLDVDYSEDADGDIIANRFQAPVTKRNELSIPGDWKSQGKICLRQVDPLHFEILSIIPDLEDMRR